jgi:hypothetical protein
MFTSAPGQDPYARLLGVWEYRQANSSRPSGFDKEGERIRFRRKGNAIQGLYFGLERNGDHGLAYTLVELANLTVSGDAISFSVPARRMYTKRPTHFGEGRPDGGFTRDELKYEGTISNETLTLRCSSQWRSCPDRQIVFRRQARAEEPTGCAVANTRGPALESLSLPTPLKERLMAYRQRWRSLCAGSASRPSVEDLLGEATEIRDAVEGEAADAIAAIPGRVLPGLGGGHEGTLDLDKDEFSEAAGAKGTETDRHFWRHYPELSEHRLPTWIEATWDYGGCWRFGDYDWIAALNAVSALRSRPLGPTYGRLLRWAEEGLWDGLAGPHELCTCGPASAVVPDLEAILRFVDQTPSLREHAPAIGARIKAIRSGGVTVRSQADGHCSGG